MPVGRPAPDAFGAVRTFVAEQLGVRLERVRPGTRLEEDLGVTGDDAGELMEAFFARFGVDPAGFAFERHFGPEGWDWGAVVAAAAGHPRARTAPVTVADLAEAADRRAWPAERFPPPAPHGPAARAAHAAVAWLLLPPLLGVGLLSAAVVVLELADLLHGLIGRSPWASW